MTWYNFSTHSTQRAREINRWTQIYYSICLYFLSFSFCCCFWCLLCCLQIFTSHFSFCLMLPASHPQTVPSSISFDWQWLDGNWLIFDVQQCFKHGTLMPPPEHLFVTFSNVSFNFWGLCLRICAFEYSKNFYHLRRSILFW